MQSAEEFLLNKSKFQLGFLPTEQPHPETKDLSEWARHDLDKGINQLHGVDRAALNKIAGVVEHSLEIGAAVSETLKSGGRVFLCGCGATGRLALSLEYLWRKKHPKSEQVLSFMAGGDVALVHSLEGFEDFPDRGARQMLELGFSQNDLLIASSEGGETPFVIGAVEEAAKLSKFKPFFLYCNPTALLREKIERSRAVIDNPKVRAREVFVGPMALSGSTRMQASTALMLIIGVGLLNIEDGSQKLLQWIDYYSHVDLSFLKPFIVKESEIYSEGHKTIYQADEFAITVMTDTTERAPTFNLAAFDNQQISQSESSLSYLMIFGAYDMETAWRLLLARSPRPLNWPDVSIKATPQYQGGFDFSQRALGFRKKLLPQAQHYVFEIAKLFNEMVWRFASMERRLLFYGKEELFHHLTLKMMLNVHSTLIMGRLGRFEGNFMTWVYPSNGKLVDRAARYSTLLLERQGARNVDYDQIVRLQFELKQTLKSTDSIVIKTAERYLENNPAKTARA